MDRKRLSEYIQRSLSQDRYVFTEFLTEADAADACAAAPSGEAEAFGGMAEAERKVVRFGNEERIGYDVPWPVTLLHVTPLSEKFADELTHRDYLGAILHLGLERDIIGDIIVQPSGAYVFVLEHIADFIMDELCRIRHTSVRAERVDTLPEDCAPKLQEASLVLASPRLDALASKAFHLSRAEAKRLAEKGLISIGGRPAANADALPKDGVTISVRGHGKFIYDGIARSTKKGNCVAEIRYFR